MMGSVFQSNWFFAVMALVTSFVVTLIAIPSIINIAEQKHLYDEPDERKSHASKIPTLGGVAIFGGFIIALSIWSDMAKLNLLQFVLAGSCIVFLVGAKDDIVDLAPKKKFIGQLIAAIVIVIIGNIRFTSFHDLFPGFEVPYLLSVVISIFTILVIVNSFNLIDGINALSATVGIIITLTFGTWFWLNQEYQMSILALSLIGSLVAFLKFNASPARIFMGDTGSLIIGFVSAVMAIKFVESHHGELLDHGYFVNAAPAVAISFLGLPLFDLLRAFSIRIMKGKSPFSPDRNHVHHMLLDCGLTHMQSTFILAMLQIVFIILAVYLQSLGLNSWVIIAIVLGVSVIFSYALSRKRSKKPASNIDNSKNFVKPKRPIVTEKL